MSKASKPARICCFFCARTRLKEGSQEVQIRTRHDPRPTRVILCAQCYEEIFGPPREEKTNAKKER